MRVRDLVALGHAELQLGALEARLARRYQALVVLLLLLTLLLALVAIVFIPILPPVVAVPRARVRVSSLLLKLLLLVILLLTVVGREVGHVDVVVGVLEEREGQGVGRLLF